MVCILTIFFILINFDGFLAKKGQQNCRNRKTVFCWIFFCWEASIYQISENFIKWLGLCQFSSFLIKICCFLAKKKQKMQTSKIGLCGFIYYWGIKFLKISSNSSQDNLWQTCGWTHKGESIGPFGLQPGTKKKITDRNKMLYTGIESFYW